MRAAAKESRLERGKTRKKEAEEANRQMAMARAAREHALDGDDDAEDSGGRDHDADPKGERGTTQRKYTDAPVVSLRPEPGSLLDAQALKRGGR